MKLRFLLPLIAAFSMMLVAFAPAQAKPGTSGTEVDKNGRKLPPRDPKTGRFIKKADAGKMGAKKGGPARDPKTGRFMKKADGDKGKMEGKKGMPARDPKTGRFMKKGAGKMEGKMGKKGDKMGKMSKMGGKK